MYYLIFVFILLFSCSPSYAGYYNCTAEQAWAYAELVSPGTNKEIKIFEGYNQIWVPSTSQACAVYPTTQAQAIIWGCPWEDPPECESQDSDKDGIFDHEDISPGDPHQYYYAPLRLADHAGVLLRSDGALIYMGDPNISVDSMNIVLSPQWAPQTDIVNYNHNAWGGPSPFASPLDPCHPPRVKKIGDDGFDDDLINSFSNIPWFPMDEPPKLNDVLNPPPDNPDIPDEPDDPSGEDADTDTSDNTVDEDQPDEPDEPDDPSGEDADTDTSDNDVELNPETPQGTFNDADLENLAGYLASINNQAGTTNKNLDQVIKNQGVITSNQKLANGFLSSINTNSNTSKETLKDINNGVGTTNKHLDQVIKNQGAVTKNQKEANGILSSINTNTNTTKEVLGNVLKATNTSNSGLSTLNSRIANVDNSLKGDGSAAISSLNSASGAVSGSDAIVDQAVTDISTPLSLDDIPDSNESILKSEWNLYDQIVETMSHNPVSDALTGIDVQCTGDCSFSYNYNGRDIDFNLCPYASQLNSWGSVLLMISSLHAVLILFKKK